MYDMLSKKIPDGEDIILYLDHGRVPVIAALFDGEWRTSFNVVIRKDIILGWNFIPEYSYT
jgi:hypothetical protein